MQEVATLNAIVRPYRPRLTPRENEVLDCMLSGWKNRETAEELGIREKTVKIHVNSIRRAIHLPKGYHFKQWLRHAYQG